MNAGSIRVNNDIGNRQNDFLWHPVLLGEANIGEKCLLNKIAQAMFLDIEVHLSGREFLHVKDIVDQKTVATWRRPMQLSNLICGVNRQIEQILDTGLRSHSLSIEQYRVLKAVNSENGVAMGDLAACVFVDSPTLTKIIDKMVASADVYRGPDPRDRRRVLIFLSDKGAARLEAVRSIEVDVEQQLAELLGHEQTDFIRHLRAILVNARRPTSSAEQRQTNSLRKVSDLSASD
jgi:DNA-binding MarR family transcriptional regulator